MAIATRSGRFAGLFSHEMEITEQEINRRKAFLEFRKEDADALRSLNEVAQRYADPVIEDLAADSRSTAAPADHRRHRLPARADDYRGPPPGHSWKSRESGRHGHHGRRDHRLQGGQ